MSASLCPAKKFYVRTFQNKDGGRTDWTCFKGKIESPICRDRGQRQKCPDSVCKE